MSPNDMLPTEAGTPVEMGQDQHKNCKHCGKSLPLSAFYLSRTKYSARCKACHRLTLRTCRVCGLQFEGGKRRILCSPACKSVHRPQTFKSCVHCSRVFGPVKYLKTRHCSRDCKNAAQRRAVRQPRPQATKLARAAQSAVARAIKAGELRRPTTCSACGRDAKIEAAHADYHIPLDIRWLCRSCHS